MKTTEVIEISVRFRVLFLKRMTLDETVTKCLLYILDFKDKNSLQKHYIDKHKVNFNNCFFKALFKKDKGKFFVWKCYRCEQFLASRNEEKTHNFLKYYQKGKQLPVEYKPIEIKTKETYKTFSTEFDKHKNSYNFADPIKLPEDFFNVVDIEFNTDGEKELIFKSTFTIVNYQPPPEDLPGSVGIFDKRLWSTQTYFGNFFNDFIRFSLINDIKKRIIVNQETGSSWQFNTYDYISVTLNTVENQKIVRQ